MIKSQWPTLLRHNPRLRMGAVLGLLLAVGIAFSLSGVSLVRAATATISAQPISAPLPETDPFSPFWDRSPQAVVPMSAQQMWQPGGGGTTPEVRVRALHNGKRIAFLLNWTDDTRNDYVKDVSSDAAAIELPFDAHNLPYQCMGMSGNRVNIWQWKAALQQVAQDTGQANNGVRNLTSNGMGKAVETPGVVPTGDAVWRDGQWYLVFARAVSAGDSGSAPLLVGSPTNAAFAIWNGAKGETRAMKSVSTWMPVEIAEVGAAGATNYLVLGVSILAAVGAVALAWRLIPR